jgi:hypothetical protein
MMPGATLAHIPRILKSMSATVSFLAVRGNRLSGAGFALLFRPQTLLPFGPRENFDRHSENVALPIACSQHGSCPETLAANV